MIPTSTWYLVLAAVLFGVGAFGLMVRRNPLVMFMCTDIDGQTAVFFVMVVAAAEVVVGLGIIISIMRRRPGATVDDLAELKG